VVGRYHASLRCWEVWNEENIGFWKDTSQQRAAHYAELLRVTHAAVKAVDPRLQVLLGGLAGVDIEYLDSLYAHGAAAAFDILNVHPYRYPGPPESISGSRPPLVDQIQQLRDAMTRNGDTQKPVWFTEVGWPTHFPDAGQTRWSAFVRNCLRTLDTPGATWKIAFLDDPSYPPGQSAPIDDVLLGLLSPNPGSIVERVPLNRLPGLNTDGYRVLVMPPGEHFPVDYYDDIAAFVRSGGTLVLSSGVPLYYAESRLPDGSWNTTTADARYRRGLHLDFEARWFTPAAPDIADSVAVAAPFADSILPAEDTWHGMRFLSNAVMQEGDSLVPVVMAYDSAYEAPLAAIYRLDSDSMTGNVIVTTQWYTTNTGVPVERQAQMLARTYLLSCNRAVDRVFWYEFRANENDSFYNEDHFGIVHRDFTPKPAYTAFGALTRARPAGSVELDTATCRFDNVMVFRTHWLRPDGVHGWALWSLETPASWQISCTGIPDSAFDLYGREIGLNVQSESVVMTLDQQVRDLFGPTALELGQAGASAAKNRPAACAMPTARMRADKVTIRWPAAAGRECELFLATLSGRLVWQGHRRATSTGILSIVLSSRTCGAASLVATIRSGTLTTTIVLAPRQVGR